MLFKQHKRCGGGQGWKYGTVRILHSKPRTLLQRTYCTCTIPHTSTYFSILKKSPDS